MIALRILSGIILLAGISIACVTQNTLIGFISFLVSSAFIVAVVQIESHRHNQELLREMENESDIQDDAEDSE